MRYTARLSQCRIFVLAARSLQTVVMFMFQTGFESGDVNLAAATAVVFFLLTLGMTVVSFRVFLSREFRARGQA